MERQLKDYEIQCLDSRLSFLTSILQKLTRENQLAITEDGLKTLLEDVTLSFEEEKEKHPLLESFVKDLMQASYNEGSEDGYNEGYDRGYMDGEESKGSL